MTDGFDFAPYLSALRRRWWAVLLPIILLAPLVVMIAFVIPPTYRASARVLVESQQIPSELAQSTVTASVSERIALIEQRLMTRDTLLEIASEYDVTAGMGDLSASEIVDMMRGSTRITGIQFAGERSPVNGIDISFTTHGAALAAQVANEFLTRLLSQNVEQRNRRASETSDYFRSEVKRLADQLTRLKKQRADFKIENEDALPDSLVFRRGELGALEERMFERELRLIELEQQRKELVDALERGDFLPQEGAASPEEQQLEALKLALTQKSALFAPSHPEIRALQGRIDALQQRLGGAAQGQGGGEASDEPARRALLRFDDQIQKLKTQIDNDASQIASLQGSIARTPQAELRLNELELELTAVETQYRNAVLKLSQAETGERLEVNQQAERFEVIERAEIPTSAFSPNRPLIVAAGMVGAVGIGFGLLVLLEFFDKSLRRSADMEKALELRPVVTIPYIETQREHAVRSWGLRLAVLTVLVLLPLSLFLIDLYVMPLLAIMERVAEKTGIDTILAQARARLGR